MLHFPVYLSQQSYYSRQILCIWTLQSKHFMAKMQEIQLLPNIKYIAPQTGIGVRWCWSNTWSLCYLTVILSSLQYLRRKKGLYLRNWDYSSSPVTLQYMLWYINWGRTRLVFSDSKRSAVPCYRRRIFETEILKPIIKPTVL